MRAAVYRRFGAPDVVRVEELPPPVPRPNEVLVRVRASTVSAADYRARTRIVPAGLGVLAALSLGVFRPRRRILGMDVAGVVEAVGAEVTAFAPGDEVIAMLGARFGGHAELVCVPHDGAIARKPSTLDFAESAALVFGGITALAFLDRAGIRSGTRVLVNGASGAVGTAAVQLAAWRGAHVTGVCGPSNADLVRRLGAREVVDYTSTDFAASGAAFDVVVDCVGNAPFERVGPILNPGGALLLVVADLRAIIRAPGHSRRSGKLVSAGSVAYTAAALASLARLADRRLLRPVIDRSYPLSDIVEAHRYVAAGHKAGSVILEVSAS